ncbi:MAG: hypothetical protein ACO1OO_03830 [Flavisolibacter sp.]
MKLVLAPIVAILFFISAAAQNFKVGDRVEASYAGDWLRAVVTGPFETNEFGSTYLVKYDGVAGESRINAKFVRNLFRPDEKQTFTAGEVVEFQRWDNSVHEGEIVGVDGKKYQVRFQFNGYPSTEWVNELLVRPSAKTAAAKPAMQKPSAQKPAPAAPKAVPAAAKANSGQRFRIGDRVMYDDLGFLVTKSYGIVVGYDAEKRLYTIRNEKDASLRYSYACYNVYAPDEAFSNDFFIGSWQVYLSGAMTTQVDRDKVITTYSGGMKMLQLDIRADGTYSWRVDKNKVIRGKWTPRTDLPGIVIIKGIDGMDWTVYQTTEAFATNGKTRDEIRFHNLPTHTGYYLAERIGPNKSCVLAGRKF